MADATGRIAINGVTYRLAERNGARQFAAGQDTSVENDAQPFRLVLPFGNWGMGARYETGTHNQFDYGYDIEVSTWGELGAGLEQGVITYSTGTVVTMEQVRDDLGRRLLYVGGTVNAATMSKINIDATPPADISGAQITFAHGTNTTITDITALKDGAATGLTPRGAPAGVGTGRLLVSFGETAYIRQMDTVNNSTGADTYRTTGANTAFGGLFERTIAGTSTEARVWKTTAATTNGGGALVNGAFSRLQSAVVNASDYDYTNATNWTPTTPLQVGDLGSSITGLTPYQRGLVVGKPEGVYGFDANGNSYIAFGTSSYITDENAKNLTAWGTQLFIPTAQDLAAIGGVGTDGMIGITRLPSPPSGAAGYPTALASYGQWLYAAYYDGTTTNILKFRGRQGENVPGPFLVYPVTRFTGICRKMMVATNQSGKTYLFYGKGGDVGYTLLDTYGTSTGRTYASSGTWYSSTFGDPAVPFVIERIDTFGADTSASAYWVVGVSVDGGITYTNYGNVNTAGRSAINFTPGSSDYGTLGKVRLVCVNGTNTNNPRLIGGGIIVEGTKRPQPVDTLEFVLVAGPGGVSLSPATVFDNLTAIMRAGTAVNMSYTDYRGSPTAFKVIIKQVRYDEGPGDGETASSRYIRVKVSKLFGS